MSDPSESHGSGGSAVSMRTMEIVVALILVAFGATIAYSSYQLGSKWASDGPQSGYFPFYIGLFILVSSLVTLVQALRDRASGQQSFVDRGPLRQVFAVLLPAALYVVAIQLFGLYFASLVYITLFMVWLGHYSWFKSTSVALGVSVFSFMLFEVWFQVPLHKGNLFNPLSLIGY